jgi:ABC-type transport system involved in multi-copper enzyme maturation permease subunit
MRLLSAELRKLNRPLTWALAAFAMAFCLLLAVGAASNAHADLGSMRGDFAASGVSDQLSPAAAGAEAAGLMASLPGAFLAALLAGGHIGGEWTGRTLKNLLSHNGFRTRILAAKLVSTWLVLVVISVLCWTALAAVGWLIVSANGLPHATEAVSTGLSHSITQEARALLILGFFAALGLATAVVTRGTVGTIAGTVAAVVALLALATPPAFGKWTPATWVEAWMGFPPGQRSISTLPTNFWSRFTGSGTLPGHTLALVGMIGSIAVLAAMSWQLFRRMDVV